MKTRLGLLLASKAAQRTKKIKASLLEGCHSIQNITAKEVVGAADIVEPNVYYYKDEIFMPTFDCTS